MSPTRAEATVSHGLVCLVISAHNPRGTRTAGGPNILQVVSAMLETRLITPSRR
ncbi:MAG TPA: hypothetical protein VMS08_02345 [Candidatus Saccharimonadia bacterium]|nr:hypothetical protein [Candidatus Saccharimonadia bacterium]